MKQSLAQAFPEQVKKYWDFEKNGELRPEKVGTRSAKTIWIICPTCQRSRPQKAVWVADLWWSNGPGQCEECRNSAGTPLIEAFPDQVEKYWDFEKNGALSPAQVTTKSQKNVFFRCPDCRHEWETRVAAITRSWEAGSSGCDKCGREAGARKRRKTAKDYEAVAAEVGIEWLGPMPQRANQKTRWRCSCGKPFERSYTAEANTKRLCPDCGQESRVQARRLTEQDYLNLAAEHGLTWLGLLPPNTATDTEWQCGAGHPPWTTTYSTIQTGSTCPECAKESRAEKRRLPEEDYRKLAAEHGIEYLGPYPGNVDSVTDWQCQMGHVWPARYSGIKAGFGCPICSRLVSSLDMRLYAEMHSLFPRTRWHYLEAGPEIDVYIPEIQVGIEADGYYWHRKRESNDIAKGAALDAKGITLLRLRETPLVPLSAYDVIFGAAFSNNPWPTLCELAERLLRLAPPEHHAVLQKYLRGEGPAAEAEFQQLMASKPAPPPGESLATLYPELCEEWAWEQNGALTPEMFTPGSNWEVYWHCKKNPKHPPWKVSIVGRTNQKRGCPYCSGRRVIPEESIAPILPTLSVKWHPTKNEQIDPATLGPGSNKKVWWLCPKCGHEWRTSICSVVGNGAGCRACYFASQRTCEVRAAALKGNTLAELLPMLHVRPHPMKDLDLDLSAITRGSGKKIWWICPECGHEWQALVHNICNKGKGCRECTNRARRKNRP